MEPKELNHKIEATPENKSEKPSGLGGNFEQVKRVEQQEQTGEKTIEKLDQEGSHNTEQNNLAAAAQGFTTSNHLAEREKKVEKILEEGLEKIYANLSPEKKSEFRRTGEVTAHQINLMLSGAKIKMKKLINLIRDWLKIIPGINFFFLEQEAKIKADEIIKLKDHN